ncbi:hypothetical protein BV20DRAFT_733900 [Pilatotrama ljubarskyi]|nr:hypothetical protein BV20DRAFT_733900 [Pilatotrama ljubarskyi]
MPRLARRPPARAGQSQTSSPPHSARTSSPPAPPPHTPTNVRACPQPSSRAISTSYCRTSVPVLRDPSVDRQQRYRESSRVYGYLADGSRQCVQQSPFRTPTLCTVLIPRRAGLVRPHRNSRPVPADALAPALPSFAPCCRIVGLLSPYHAFSPAPCLTLLHPLRIPFLPARNPRRVFLPSPASLSTCVRAWLAGFAEDLSIASRACMSRSRNMHHPCCLRAAVPLRVCFSAPPVALRVRRDDACAATGFEGRAQTALTPPPARSPCYRGATTRWRTLTGRPEVCTCTGPALAPSSLCLLPPPSVKPLLCGSLFLVSWAWAAETFSSLRS